MNAENDVGIASRPPPTHYPNFEILRLIAASTVIFSHAFLIAEGTEKNEPLVRALGEHNILGIYGVFVFFHISGFLVAQSADRSSSVASFLWKRFLRIYPALLLCAAVSGCVLGSIYTSAGTVAYWEDMLGPKYVAWTAIAPSLRWRILTIEFYRDSTGYLGQVINGSLWTIPQEIFCYIVLGALSAVGLLRRWTPPILTITTAACSLAGLATGSELIDNFIYIAPAFFAGSSVYVMGRNSRCVARFSMVGLAALPIAALFGHLSEAFQIFAAAPILLLATSSRLRLPSLGRIGDISYGAYLYGWPTEQVVRASLGEHATWWSVFAISLPIALGLGWASWNLIEKRALGLKDLSPQRLRARLARPSAIAGRIE